MPYGDQIKVWRGGYFHHGVEVEDGNVIHFAKDASQQVTVNEVTLQAFAGGGEIVVVSYAQRVSPEEAVQTAKTLVGQTGYGLFTNNCEHLARRCVVGEHSSLQVDHGVAVGGAALVLRASAALGLEVMARAGSVKGFSGAGVMSALGRSGSRIGGGVVDGIALLSLLPAALGVGLTFHGLQDRPELTDDARRARQIGRSVALLGAAAGIATEAVLIRHMGAAPGLSGPGITSGLKSIGSLANGGMVRGAVVGLMPMALAVVGSYLAYWISTLYFGWRETGGPLARPGPTRADIDPPLAVGPWS